MQGLQVRLHMPQYISPQASREKLEVWEVTLILAAPFQLKTCGSPLD